MTRDEPGRRTEPYDESLFDSEPSPQPDRIPSKGGESKGAVAGAASREGGVPEGPGIADGVARTLDDRYIILHRIIGAIITAVVGLNVMIGAPILLLTAPLAPWLIMLIIASAVVFTMALGWFCWIWPGVEHRWTSYRVGPTGIEIRRGVFWRKVIVVPRSRVQHTDVSQGPLERRFSLGTLHIFTAGTEHSKVELPGLTHDDALKVRDHLVKGGADDAV